MKEIHFVLQGKGGVGKSFIASLLTQYLLSLHKGFVYAFDTDPVNQTLSRYKLLNVRMINILSENNNIDSIRFDALTEFLLENDGFAVIDNGAATFLPLLAYITENKIIGILRESGARVVFHVPLQGGQALADTVEGLKKVLTEFDVDVVVWLNEHQGTISLDDTPFADIQNYQNQAAGEKIIGVIKIESKNADTFGRAVKAMTEQHLTVAEILSGSPAGWTFMPRQRIKNIWEEITIQLSQQPLFRNG